MHIDREAAAPMYPLTACSVEQFAIVVEDGFRIVGNA
jgi:hypothetical protein